MQTNVLDYLEKTVKLVPNKIAYANEKESHAAPRPRGEKPFLQGSGAGL